MEVLIRIRICEVGEIFQVKELRSSEMKAGKALMQNIQDFEENV
jgi:hypothetical protein